MQLSGWTIFILFVLCEALAHPHRPLGDTERGVTPQHLHGFASLRYREVTSRTWASEGLSALGPMAREDSDPRLTRSPTLFSSNILTLIQKLRTLRLRAHFIAGPHSASSRRPRFFYRLPVSAMSPPEDTASVHRRTEPLSLRVAEHVQKTTNERHLMNMFGMLLGMDLLFQKVVKERFLGTPRPQAAAAIRRAFVFWPGFWVLGSLALRWASWRIRRAKTAEEKASKGG